MNNTVEIMNRESNCLIEKLGVLETEHFISVIMREKFDYTLWQKKQFDDVDSNDFNNAAIAYAKDHPFINN